MKAARPNKRAPAPRRAVSPPGAGRPGAAPADPERLARRGACAARVESGESKAGRRPARRLHESALVRRPSAAFGFDRGRGPPYREPV